MTMNFLPKSTLNSIRIVRYPLESGARLTHVSVRHIAAAFDLQIRATGEKRGWTTECHRGPTKHSDVKPQKNDSGAHRCMYRRTRSRDEVFGNLLAVIN